MDDFLPRFQDRYSNFRNDQYIFSQQLQHSALAAAGFSAVVAAAANSHNQPSAPLPPNPGTCIYNLLTFSR